MKSGASGRDRLSVIKQNFSQILPKETLTQLVPPQYDLATAKLTISVRHRIKKAFNEITILNIHLLGTIFEVEADVEISTIAGSQDFAIRVIDVITNHPSDFLPVERICTSPEVTLSCIVLLRACAGEIILCRDKPPYGNTGVISDKTRTKK